MKSKYVIMKDFDDYFHVFVIGGCMLHSDIKRAFPNLTVVSAGFCSIDSVNPDYVDRPLVEVWGESVSLGVKSRPEDSEILSRNLCAL